MVRLFSNKRVKPKLLDLAFVCSGVRGVMLSCFVLYPHRFCVVYYMLAVDNTKVATQTY